MIRMVYVTISMDLLDIMKMTTKSEYALLALIHIARYGQKSFIRVESICRQYGISKKYLEQLLFVLKRQQYIATKRGSDGGYQLLKQAELITLAEIIRLMDGALAPTSSVSKNYYQETPIKKEPKALDIFQDIRDFTVKTLEKITINDLV